jgi:dCTP deaminase
VFVAQKAMRPGFEHLSEHIVSDGDGPPRWTAPRAPVTAPRPSPSETKDRRRARAAQGTIALIKSDKWILRMAREQRIIEPFEPGQVREANGHRIVSYGTSSYGYDIRCSDEFKIFTNINSTIVDPKAFDAGSFVDFKGDVCIIPPNSFALARTIEYFRIPRNVLTICLGKSTYARCGIIVNVTPFEPEWEGFVTLEFSNTTPLPAKIYANEGVAQVIFFESDEVCETSRVQDRGGSTRGSRAYATQDLMAGSASQR